MEQLTAAAHREVLQRVIILLRVAAPTSKSHVARGDPGDRSPVPLYISICSVREPCLPPVLRSVSSCFSSGNPLLYYYVVRSIRNRDSHIKPFSPSLLRAAVHGDFTVFLKTRFAHPCQ